MVSVKLPLTFECFARFFGMRNASFSDQKEDYKYKTNININLKPKIIAKPLLCLRLFIPLNMNSKKKAQELFEKHGFEIANSIIDTMLDENLPEFNQSKIDFWLDVKNDLKRVALAVVS